MQVLTFIVNKYFEIKDAKSKCLNYVHRWCFCTYHFVFSAELSDRVTIWQNANGRSLFQFHFNQLPKACSHSFRDFAQF